MHAPPSQRGARHESGVQSKFVALLFVLGVSITALTLRIAFALTESTGSAMDARTVTSLSSPVGLDTMAPHTFRSHATSKHYAPDASAHVDADGHDVVPAKRHVVGAPAKSSARGLDDADFAEETDSPATPPNTPATQQPTPPPLCYEAHAFYYPWYGSRAIDGKWRHWDHPYLPHWEKEVTDRYPKGRHDPDHGDVGASFYPVLGPYSSADNATIDQHLDWFVRGGIGVLVFSWYPPHMADENGAPSDCLVPVLLDRMAPKGIKLAFHSEPYGSRTEVTLKHDITYIVDTYGDHPALYRAGPENRPVIYVYDAYHVKMERWADVFGRVGGAGRSSGRHDSIRGTRYDVIAIALMLHIDDDEAYMTVGGFDGVYNYFASRTFTEASNWERWGAISGSAGSHGRVFVPSIGPGYDDLQVRPWNAENVQERAHGGNYNNSFRQATDAVRNEKRRGLADDLKWVSITSFNEWHEGTQIEPASTKRAGVHSTFANFEYKRYGTPVGWPGPPRPQSASFSGVVGASATVDAKGDGFDPYFYLDLTRHWLFHAPGAVCATERD